VGDFVGTSVFESRGCVVTFGNVKDDELRDIAVLFGGGTDLGAVGMEF
jgi:hypothetical protein